VNIQNVLLWLKGRHGDACSAGQSLQPSYQSEAASNHTHPALLFYRLVAELCGRFCVVSWFEVKAVRWPQIRKFLGWRRSLRLL